jgi:hypothetical protein
MSMAQINHDADPQIERLNSRIAQVAADYERSKIKRAIWLQAGDFRRAGEITRRLRLLNSELAYLASQRRLWDTACSKSTRH